MRLSLAIAGLAIALSSSVGAQTFSDQTFNLGDYTIVQSLSVGTVTVTQTTTEGNPGSAIKATFDVPASPGDELGSVFYINNGFTYDASNSGALSTVSFSIDKSVDLVPPPDPNFGNGQSFLIYQGGSYYVRGVALPSVIDAYQTAMLTGSASDFSLVVDMVTGQTDSAVHPDFTSGILEFGFRNGFGLDPQTQSVVTILEDNFSVNLTPASVNAVPEPATIGLLGVGLIAGAVRRRLKR